MAGTCCWAPDGELNRREIGKFSTQRRRELSEVRGDAGARRRRDRADADADAAEPAPAGPRRPVATVASSAGRSSKLGARHERGGRGPRPARPGTILDRWFESEQLKATLATDADHRRVRLPVDAGHRLRPVPSRHGRDQRQARRLGLRQGRHGRADAGARQRRPRTSASRSAATPRCGSILVQDGPVAGVVLANGEEFARQHRRQQRRRPRDLQQADGRRACCRRTSREAIEPHRLRQRLAEDQRRPVASCRTSRACPGTQPGPQHRGTIHICPDQDYIERAYDDAKYGRPSQRPDRSNAPCRRRSIRRVAPPGKHLMSMFIQYAPYKLDEGDVGRRPRTRSPTAASTCSNEYAPNFKQSVIARQILTPLDLERTFNLTGGNIFQGAMTLNQLFCPAAGAGLRGLPHADPRAVPVRLGGPPRRRRHRGGGLERAARYWGRSSPGEARRGRKGAGTAYSDFSLEQVEKAFGVRLQMVAMFPDIAPLSPPPWLRETLARACNCRW